MSGTPTDLLARAFFKTNGPVLAFIGLLLSVGSWLIPISTTETVRVVAVLRWLVPLAIACLLAITTLLFAVFSERGNRLPRLLHARRQRAEGEQASATLLLLERSDLFSHDALVSVYHVDDSDFEELVGVGHVLNIQEDGKIQALVPPAGTVDHDLLTKVRENSVDMLRRVKVKPTVPRKFLQND